VRRRPIANVRVLKLPELGGGAVRIEVDCERSTTDLTHIPGGVDLPAPALVTGAMFEHEVRCGECTTAEVHAREARELREETERAYEAIRQRRIRYYAHGRRH